MHIPFYLHVSVQIRSITAEAMGSEYNRDHFIMNNHLKFCDIEVNNIKLSSNPFDKVDAMRIGGIFHHVLSSSLSNLLK